MAHEHSDAPSSTVWTKVFGAFKIALDLKKLTLAAMGIFLVAVGWWVFSWTFYTIRNERGTPEWK
ncbi:MAG: hypothetical protein FJ303_25595, partial [Planctomycetes bacterium]|nr:hypothetical protein [Planctomycetota bacterium]